MSDDQPVLMPSEVSSRIGFFDRFAGRASLVASRAVFFALCVLLVVLWAPTIFVLRDIVDRLAELQKFRKAPPPSSKSESTE